MALCKAIVTQSHYCYQKKEQGYLHEECDVCDFICSTLFEPVAACIEHDLSLSTCVSDDSYYFLGVCNYTSLITINKILPTLSSICLISNGYVAFSVLITPLN